MTAEGAMVLKLKRHGEEDFIVARIDGNVQTVLLAGTTQGFHNRPRPKRGTVGIDQTSDQSPRVKHTNSTEIRPLGAKHARYRTVRANKDALTANGSTIAQGSNIPL